MCENPGTNPLGMHAPTDEALPEPEACAGDAMTPEETRALLLVRERAREQGRLEGAMWMAAYIALGTWAAERDRQHAREKRFLEANAEVIAKYGPTFARMYAEERHVCGLSGYDGMRDPPCPGCMARL